MNRVAALIQSDSRLADAWARAVGPDPTRRRPTDRDPAPWPSSADTTLPRLVLDSLIHRYQNALKYGHGTTEWHVGSAWWSDHFGAPVEAGPRPYILGLPVFLDETIATDTIVLR